MSCENLKFLYTECIRKIHYQDYSPQNVNECFQTWEKLIKCVSKDIIIKGYEHCENVGGRSDKYTRNQTKEVFIFEEQ